MFRRLFASMLKPRRDGARDRRHYPVVGSSQTGPSDDVSRTVMWPGAPAASAGNHDATVPAPLPPPSPNSLGVPPNPFEARRAAASAQKRLSWPARDTSRGPGPAAPEEPIAQALPDHPPADATSLVPRGTRPRPPRG